MMKTSFFAGLALVLGAGFASATPAPVEPAQAPAEGLVEIEKGPFQSSWVNPDFDFGRYDKLVIAPNGVVDYRDVGPARLSRSRMLTSNEREFGIGEKDRERFERYTQESFSKQLARSRQFELIELGSEEKIPAGTLIVRGHLIDVVSNVAPPISGVGEVYSNRVGEASFVLEIIDPVSGMTVAYAAERNAIQRSGGTSLDTIMLSNSVTGWAEVRRWAGRIGSRLARELDAVQQV